MKDLNTGGNQEINMVIAEAMTIGIATPVTIALLQGMEGKKKKMALRSYALVGLSAFAVSALTLQFMPKPPVASSYVVSNGCGGCGRTVSGVTAQLSSGLSMGVRYPGQMTDSGLIFVD